MTIDVTIEKLIYGGDGLARASAQLDAGRRGKSVFIPFVLEGEGVRAAINEEKPGFMRARVEEIVNPSPERIVAACPYFQRCGGCHYQHTSYEQQLRVKEAILRETLRRGAKIDWQREVTVHPSPPWNYRNRARLKMRSSPFAIGYFRFGSHELLPVEQCPISSALINQAIAALWEFGRASRVPAAITELELFVNAEDNEMLAECYGASTPSEAEQFWRAARERVPQLKGMAFFTGPATSPTLAKILGEGHLFCATARGNYRVSAGSFFQVNRFMTDALLEAALPREGGRHALDLYAGGGFFAAQLAKSFQQVRAVESAQSSGNDLQVNCPPNVALRRMTTEMFLAEHSGGERYDFAIVDPPRAGLGERLAEKLAQLAAPLMTYVSCDPATLGRDLAALLKSGYELRELHLVDLFPQTYHLETVAHLSR